MQIKRHKWLVFEHPHSATTWHEPCMQKLLSALVVDWQLADQCQYGFVTLDPDGASKPAKKPTRFVSNGRRIFEELCRRCPGDHSHQPLMGGRAAAAAEYPDDLLSCSMPRTGSPKAVRARVTSCDTKTRAKRIEEYVETPHC